MSTPTIEPVIIEEQSVAQKAVESNITFAAPNPNAPPRSIVREYFESAIVTVIMALFGITFVVQAVKVPTGSMQNTINIGDQLLVNKFIFAPGPRLPFLPQRDIRRGDIIVFKYPGNAIDSSRDSEANNIPFKTNYVKRVVGLPGDAVEFRGREIYINGQLLPERRVFARDVTTESALEPSNVTPPAGAGAYTVYYQDPKLLSRDHEEIPEAQSLTRNFKFLDGRSRIEIPPGNYLAMGDNRDNSADGRDWGFVPRELIIGRAMFVYWSYDMGADSNGNPVTDFFQNSRWSRTGTLIK